MGGTNQRSCEIDEFNLMGTMAWCKYINNIIKLNFNIAIKR